MKEIDSSFRIRVEDIVRHIPYGRVMTYGQIAALAGSAYAARIVGGIAHFGDIRLPWHRVVDKKGSLASGYPGGRDGHRVALRAEGIKVSEDYYIDIQEYLWWPDKV